MKLRPIKIIKYFTKIMQNNYGIGQLFIIIDKLL